MKKIKTMTVRDLRNDPGFMEDSKKYSKFPHFTIDPKVFEQSYLPKWSWVKFRIKRKYKDRPEEFVWWYKKRETLLDMLPKASIDKSVRFNKERSEQ